MSWRLRWPRTLLGQNVLLLVATVLISQVASVVVFMVFVQAPRLKDAAGLFAAQIMTVERVLAAVPESERDNYVARLQGQQRPPEIAPAGRDDLPRGPLRLLTRYEARLFLAEVAARLPPDIVLRKSAMPSRLWVQVHIAGRPYWIWLPIQRSEGYMGGLVGAGLSLALAALAALFGYLIHRRVNRPLSQLVSAAGQLARGESPETVALSGPQEIVRAAATFNGMATALADIDAARALMLATISHDLRTPLTKLRLVLAMPALLEDAPGSAERFIDDIDAIVQQFIDYARGGEGEASCVGDLNALIGQLAADFRGLGHDFSLSLGELPPLAFRPISMMRLLVNLMQNAVLYGKTGLAVSSWTESGLACVAVVDRGPGLDAQTLESIKQPFRRGPEAARESIGSGLGLAIAEKIARQHGAILTLANRGGGGLQATLSLQLSV